MARRILRGPELASGFLRVRLPRSEAELRLPVDVDQYRVGDIPDVDRLHERELRRERLPGQRVLLGPLEPHGNGGPPELLSVILGQPDDLDSLGLVLFPGLDVRLLDVCVLIPRMLSRRG